MDDEEMAELVGTGFFDLEVDDEGDLFYKLSDDAESINPDAFSRIMYNVEGEILEFVKQGFMDYRVTDNLDFEYRWSPEGIDYLKSIGVLDEDFDPKFEE